jgi:hypothetical protein
MSNRQLYRADFYDLCLKRLLVQGIDPVLATKVAYIQVYVDGSRRRSNYEQSLIDCVWQHLISD